MSLLSKVGKAVGRAATSYGKALVTSYAGAVAGPVGQNFAQSLLGGGGSSAPGAPGDYSMAGSQGMPGSGSDYGGGGMVQTGAGTTVVKGLQMMKNWLISARGIVSTPAGKLLGVMKGTKLFNSKSIADLAKRVGIDAAAAALGLTAVEVAQLIASHITTSSSRRKRGRGISARDVRVTRRTLHKVRSIEHAISGACRPRARARSRSPAQFVRQG
jgi:hypothetical protein